MDKQITRRNMSPTELSNFPASELRVYVALLVLSGPQNSPVSISLSALSKQANLGYHTVQKMVKSLCHKGQLIWGAGDNKGQPSRFHLSSPLPWLRFGIAEGNPLGRKTANLRGKTGRFGKNKPVAIGNDNDIRNI